ncbi:hypothetical protein EMQ25_05670 [Arsenicitalea aurantiaca]|uniref:Phage terminase small subunit P27 family n=1 Tax=Arsenicitalea aurantiaca TaxID=1783274 RepID=A0A433XEW1_9HYPH|nr:hypothetical protein [Arsenicitalea aurantiaca]RUT32635.1 hypothetical protein EMQ25_05670 [Arsenicitalea aurantiaca]
MQRGPKRLPPSEKKAKGTFQKSRDGHVVEVIEPNAMPMRPQWLTAEGEEVWLDDLGRVQANRLVTEKDSTAFGNYCNLQGMIIKCFRAGEAPPITAMAEVRKLQELFGIGGAKTRLQIKGLEKGGTGNPFARNGSRS